MSMRPRPWPEIPEMTARVRHGRLRRRLRPAARNLPGGPYRQQVAAGAQPRRTGHQDRFRSRDCGPCPLRSQCTTATIGLRRLTVRPRDQHEALEHARHEQHTDAWKERYKIRAGVEGTISQAVRAGMRRSRYIGLAKTHLGVILTASAINLIRVQRRAARTAGSPRAGLAVHLGRGPVQAGHHAGQGHTGPGVVGRGVGGGVAAGARGPEHRVSQLLRLDLREAKGAQGCRTSVPVAEGFPASDPVHQERPVRSHAGRETPPAEDRGRSGSPVPITAVRSIVGDGGQGPGGPILRIVRRRDLAPAAARDGLRDRYRPGSHSFRDRLGRPEGGESAPPSASGTGKRTGSNTGTAPRADSTDRDLSRRSAAKQ